MSDILENIDDVMKAAYLQLREVERNMAAKIPEKLFVRDFLEFFRGNAPKEQFKDYLAAWYRVSGNYQAEVAVTDDAGKIVYMVPAVFNTVFLSAKPGENAMKMSDIALMYELEQQQSPHAAAARYETNLQNKLLAMINNKHKLSDIEQRWLDIFNRYPQKGEEPKPKESTAPSSAKASQVNPVLDDDEEVGFL